MMACLIRVRHWRVYLGRMLSALPKCNSFSGNSVTGQMRMSTRKARKEGEVLVRLKRRCLVGSSFPHA